MLKRRGAKKWTHFEWPLEYAYEQNCCQRLREYRVDEPTLRDEKLQRSKSLTMEEER